MDINETIGKTCVSYIQLNHLFIYITFEEHNYSFEEFRGQLRWYLII